MVPDITNQLFLRINYTMEISSVKSKRFNVLVLFFFFLPIEFNASLLKKKKKKRKFIRRDFNITRFTRYLDSSRLL